MNVYDHHQATNADGLTFEAWLGAIDRVLLRVVYVTHDCLTDWDLWRGWQENMHPAEAAAQLLDNDASSMVVPELVAQLWTAAQQELTDDGPPSRTRQPKSRHSLM